MVSFNEHTGRAKKCTFCNDRIHNGLGPACAKTCPTESIQFGFRDELVTKAEKRVETLKEMGFKEAQLYGADSKGPLGGLNAFFLLLDKPSTYDLPENPPPAPAQRPGGLAAGGRLGAARRARRVLRRSASGAEGRAHRCLRPRTGSC